MTEFSICENPDILRILYFIKILVDIVKIVIPIGLIIMVTIDCAKGVISGESKVSDIVKNNANKILSAILIFTMPTIVNIVLEIIDEETSYESCWVNAESTTIEEYQKLQDAAEETEKNNQNNNKQESNVYFSENITYSYEYNKYDSRLSYGLYTPSTASGNKKTALLVWLHGSGEVGGTKTNFENAGFLKVLNTWKLENFNAYILCPHLQYDSWTSPYAKESYYNLLDEIINEKNINTDEIVLTGHSLGAMGVLYMAYEKDDYYSALVVLSGYNPGQNVDISTLKDIPIRGYAENGLSFMENDFVNTFGKENYYPLTAAHGQVPSVVFNTDEDSDNKSDIVEWMFGVS